MKPTDHPLLPLYHLPAASEALSRAARAPLVARPAVVAIDDAQAKPMQRTTAAPLALLPQASSLSDIIEQAVNTPLPISPAASTLDLVPARRNQLTRGVAVYALGTTATGVKTFAWWVNQYPGIADKNFGVRWVVSVVVAIGEYLPMTGAMHLATEDTTQRASEVVTHQASEDATQQANENPVHLGMLTATMEATDNTFRMLQQVALHKPLASYDWTAAGALIGVVIWQGVMHARKDAVGVAPSKTNPVPLVVLAGVALLFAVGIGVAAGRGGPTGQAYALVTLATLGKTVAWWSNQYPLLKDLNFVSKWAVGSGIAAICEYLAMVDGMGIASEHGVRVGLMTAYMEVLDNALRLGQQRVLGKPLAWYDYTAAVGMGAAVGTQAIAHAVLD